MKPNKQVMEKKTEQIIGLVLVIYALLIFTIMFIDPSVFRPLGLIPKILLSPIVTLSCLVGGLSLMLASKTCATKMKLKLNLNQEMKQILSAILLVLLPLIVLGLGAILGVKYAGYYIPTIIWFGVGVIFFTVLYQPLEM